MEIEYLPLPDVAAKAAPTNAKAHEVDRIAASMAQLGYFDPVVLDERTGLMLAGHGRVEALQQLHAADADAPPAGIGTDDGAWTVPVVRGWASTDDQHAEAARTAANRLTERGGWDTDALAEVMAGLEGTDLLYVAGFDPDELDDLLAAAAADMDLPDGTAAYSEAAEPDDPTASTPGGADAPPPRRAQGLREAYLIMTVEQHADYTELVKRYRAWRGHSADEPTATALIDAMRTALDG